MSISSGDGGRVIESQDAYFSIDIETDGPIPSTYSMLSFAIVEAGHHDGLRYVLPEARESLYRELKPLDNARSQGEALNVNGLSLERLRATGSEPKVAMEDASRFIIKCAHGRRPVMVASPAAFDWMFIHWYFVTFLGSSPFGHSSCFDLKTMIAVKMNIPIARSGVKNLPHWLDGDTPRSHNALDDATNQAEVFSNVITWRRGSDWLYSHE